MLLLVRHAETDANRSGLYLGRTDPVLTARGRDQAAEVASMLPRPDMVISSPLRRARQTAEAFAVEFEIDERWMELDYGPLDGHPIGDVPPEIDERWRRDPGFAPPGVETLSALTARVHAACRDLATRAESSVVVVVSHVSPIKAALGWALDAPATVAGRLFVEDAGVSRIEFIQGRPVVRWFNRFGNQPGE
jgi:broad specificity phosphatase PhoE